MTSGTLGGAQRARTLFIVSYFVGLSSFISWYFVYVQFFRLFLFLFIVWECLFSWGVILCLYGGSPVTATPIYHLPQR
jgi:hypothetical protein